MIRCSEVSSSLAIVGVIGSAYLSAVSGAVEASFWKRGSFRSGSNIGSSRSRAGVSGLVIAPLYGIESSFCKAAMAQSGSPVTALDGVTRRQGNKRTLAR